MKLGLYTKQLHLCSTHTKTFSEIYRVYVMSEIKGVMAWVILSLKLLISNIESVKVFLKHGIFSMMPEIILRRLTKLEKNI